MADYSIQIEEGLEDEVEIEDDLADDPRDQVPKEKMDFKYSILSYGADYPIDSLVKRIKNGDIYIPSFQRGYVWNLTKASRLIESLLLGLPIPGIFLSKEGKQKLMVIDGQQRLFTLKYFYDGIFDPTGKRFVLEGLESQFEGSTYKLLKDEDRRRLDDSILHATIVRQDEPSEDNSSIYHIFERLNTGGVLLQAQEIRACIYHGKFNDLLKKLNHNQAWRSLYGKLNTRMRDQELILRFFALYFNLDEYKRPMKKFLNDFMAANRHLMIRSGDELERIFVNTIELISKHLGNKAFKPERALRAALLDAVMVGLTRRLAEGNIQNTRALKAKYQVLMSDQEFLPWTIGPTADEENVRRRITLATEAFVDLE